MPICKTNFWQCNPGVPFVIVCTVIMAVVIIFFAYRSITGKKVRKHSALEKYFPSLTTAS